MKCPNCQSTLVHSDTSADCPNCSYSFAKHTPAKKGNKYVEQVNRQIKDLLVMARIEENPAPWRQQWIIIPKRNYETNRIYNGVNRWLLSGDPEISYITDKGIEKKGLTKKEGASARFVVAWIPPRLKKEELKLSKDEQNDLMKKRRPFMVTHWVYQARDIEGLEPKTYEEDKDNKRFDNIETFIQSLGITLVEGGNQPTYSYMTDTLKVPRIEQYSSSEEYYRDLFHELAHWTGHENRLKRKRDGKDYAREELVAEMCSGYLCAYFGIEVNENSVAYIDHWIKQIDDDPYLMISAGQRAEKALEYFKLMK